MRIIRSFKEILEDNFYQEVDPRRRQEKMDSRLIREDHKEMANLSRKAIHAVWDPDAFRHRNNPWTNAIDEITE